MEQNVLEQVVIELEKAKVDCENSIVIKSNEDNSEQIASKEEELKAIMLAELEIYKNNLATNHEKELTDMKFELKIIEKLINKKKEEINNIATLYNDVDISTPPTIM